VWENFIMLMVRNSCLDPYASRDDDELWRDVRAGWVALIFVTVNKLVRFHLPGVGIVPVDAAKLMLEEPDLARDGQAFSPLPEECRFQSCKCKV
jgi:hypothetical protein